MLLPLVAFGAGCALLVDRGHGDEAADEDEEDETEGGISTDPWRLAVGTVLFLLGVCGLAELAKNAPLRGLPAVRDAGGVLGAAVGHPLHAGLGTAGRPS